MWRGAPLAGWKEFVLSISIRKLTMAQTDILEGRCEDEGVMEEVCEASTRIVPLGETENQE